MSTPVRSSLNLPSEMDSAKDPVFTLLVFHGDYFRLVLVWPSSLFSQWLLDGVQCGPREHLQK